MIQGIVDLRGVSMYLAIEDSLLKTAQFFSIQQMGSGLHPSVFQSSNESGSLTGRDLPKMIPKVKVPYIPKPCIQCVNSSCREAARGGSGV